MKSETNFSDELQAMVDVHQTGSYKGRPVLNGCGGDVVILGQIGDEVVYKHIRTLGGNNAYGRMRTGNLLNFIGKNTVSEARVGDVETKEVLI